MSSPQPQGEQPESGAPTPPDHMRGYGTPPVEPSPPGGMGGYGTPPVEPGPPGGMGGYGAPPNPAPSSGGQYSPPPAYGAPGQAPAYGPPGYTPGPYGGYNPNYDPQAKSKMVVGLLGIFLGGFGIHNFYLGNNQLGVIQIVVTIVTCGLGSIWGFVEGILYLIGYSGYQTDSTGRPLKD